MLLIGAGLLVRSFVRLQQMPPGFNPLGVLTLELTMSGRKYTDGRRSSRDVSRSSGARLDRLPGVTRSRRRLGAAPEPDVRVGPDHRRRAHAARQVRSFINADQRIVAGHYFAAMQIPLLRGRFFNEHDTRERRASRSSTSHGASSSGRTRTPSASGCAPAIERRWHPG